MTLCIITGVDRDGEYPGLWHQSYIPQDQSGDRSLWGIHTCRNHCKNSGWSALMGCISMFCPTSTMIYKQFTKVLSTSIKLNRDYGNVWHWLYVQCGHFLWERFKSTAHSPNAGNSVWHTLHINSWTTWWHNKWPAQRSHQAPEILVQVSIGKHSNKSHQGPHTYMYQPPYTSPILCPLPTHHQTEHNRTQHSKFQKQS